MESMSQHYQAWMDNQTGLPGTNPGAIKHPFCTHLMMKAAHLQTAVKYYDSTHSPIHHQCSHMWVLKVYENMLWAPVMQSHAQLHI